MPPTRLKQQHLLTKHVLENLTQNQQDIPIPEAHIHCGMICSYCYDALIIVFLGWQSRA